MKSLVRVPDKKYRTGLRQGRMLEVEFMEFAFSHSSFASFTHQAETTLAKKEPQSAQAQNGTGLPVFAALQNRKPLLPILKKTARR